MPKTVLYTTWRKQARTLREYGAETPTVAIESCAAQLEEAIRQSDEATLTLTDAARAASPPTISGALCAKARSPTPGRHGAPSIARRHLPKKTGAATPRLASQPPRREVSTVQIVQSVIDGG